MNTLHPEPAEYKNRYKVHHQFVSYFCDKLIMAFTVAVKVIAGKVN